MQTFSKYTEVLLQNHLFQGYTNHCGPFCTAIVLNTVKKSNIAGETIVEIMNKPSWNKLTPSIKRIPNGATFPWGIVETFSEFGIPSTWQAFSSFTKLEDELSSDFIFIILTALRHPVSAHYRVLTTIKEDIMGFVDPALPEKNITWQEKQLFIESWWTAGNILIRIPFNPS